MANYRDVGANTELCPDTERTSESFVVRRLTVSSSQIKRLFTNLMNFQ